MTKPALFSLALPAFLALSLLLALAWSALRRSAANQERACALRQLSIEREARSQADQALAASQDVMCRLVRQHEGVREGERSRIARDLQSELGRRLLLLRSELSRLHDSAEAAPVLARRLDGALANVDGAITAVRAVAGGLRGFGPGDGLRHALERCLAEHAELHGLRYRFEAGVDPLAPGARGGQERAARLAVLRVLQEVLAAGARDGHGGEVAVRLTEGASALGLAIDGCGAAHGADSLPAELREQVHALGGVMRGGSRWTLSIPLGELAEVA